MSLDDIINKLDNQKVEDVYNDIYVELSLIKPNYAKNIHSVNNLKCHFSMTLSYEHKYNRTFKDYRLNDADNYRVMLCAITKAVTKYKVRIKEPEKEKLDDLIEKYTNDLSCAHYKKADSNNAHRVKCNYTCDGLNTKCVDYISKHDVVNYT